ncbi:MAG: ABC transporter ATP-binding protein [Mesorhizobium sp.]|uniref:ABC transporter ATP-binding protein n=1 Tax=Mesorhizobium sp. TaxID=1871066 RepID=UPI001AC87362|nr:ABC transporter ATP-binding protein [Mesorhizobium sp.]MBN9220320.1 ABC transporter ATP-binding protein [Mesorhizobium sp.]
MTLSAVDLSFGYGSTPLGSGLTLSIEQGEVLCLLGPNGCGKTTLFKTLLGLIPSLGGRLELDGRPVASFSRVEFARRVGYVPQASAGYFPFEVLDVVLMGRASRIGTFAAPSRADHAIAMGMLDTLGIAHLAARSFSAISGGERQLALVARALAQEPSMLVMDEPTASLDFGNQARVLERIGALAASGLTIVLSTHDPGHAFACADKVALMKNGAIVATGAPETVLTAEALGALYGVDVAVSWLEQARHHVAVPVLRTSRARQAPSG